MVRSSHVPPPASPKKRSIQPLIWVIVCCLAPIVLAFLAYYAPGLGLRPDETTNYGTLINPQRPIPSDPPLALTTLDGKPYNLASLKGQWVLVSAGPGACPESCVTKLYILRNSHASQGKNVERLNRVWFVTDDAPISEQILDAYRGTIILRVDPVQLAGYLTPKAGGEDAAPSLDQARAALAEPMWIIDPLGNLMIQFPGNADPILVRKDISKLIYNSRIG